MLAHQSTVEAVNKAGNDLIASSAGEEASSLQNKLEVLNQRWQNVLEKTEQRKQQLDGALRQVSERPNPETFCSLRDQEGMAFLCWSADPGIICTSQGAEETEVGTGTESWCESSSAVLARQFGGWLS